MTKPLTASQEAVLNYMRIFFEDNDQLPPIAAIKKHFGWSSNNAVATHCDALEAKGALERNAVGKFRFARKASL